MRKIAEILDALVLPWIWIIFVCVGAALIVACPADDCPPCEECPPCVECPDCPLGEHLECVADPEPPDPDDPKPEDYIALKRAKLYLDWFQSNDGLPDHIWTCIRNPEYVLGRCSQCAGKIGYDFAYIRALAEYSEGLHREAYSWLPRLETVNRRCDTLGGAWCDQTNIHKDNVWRPQFIPFWDAFHANLAECAALTKLAEDYWGRSFDGMKHWCKLVEAGELECNVRLILEIVPPQSDP